MSQMIEKLPKALGMYLRKLMNDEGFDSTIAGQERFIKGWFKKRALFEKIVEHNGFVLVDKIEEDFRQGILIITYSGSLLTITAEKKDGTRDLRYESIELRRDSYPNIEESSITIDFPIELNRNVNINGGRLVKTSPVFSIAVEEEALESFDASNRRFRSLGERISRALLLVNQALFEKDNPTSALENREDLFKHWEIINWFRTGGWEEEVYLARAHMLWLELFASLYSKLKEKFPGRDERDRLFLEICNPRFSAFFDAYKWLESEKHNMDIGLMKALEEIPGGEKYKEFLKKVEVEIFKESNPQ